MMVPRVLPDPGKVLIGAFLLTAPFSGYMKTFGLGEVPIFFLCAALAVVPVRRVEQGMAIGTVLFILAALAISPVPAPIHFYRILAAFLVFFAGIQFGLSRRMFWILVFVACCAVIYACYQVFYGYESHLRYLRGLDIPNKDAIITRMKSGRAYSVFILPSLFAQYMILVLCLALDRGLLRNLSLRLLVVLVCLAGIVMSRSMTGMVSVFVVFVLWLVSNRDRWKLAFSCFLIVLLCGVFIVQQRGGDFLSADNPALLRFYNWQTSLEISRDFAFRGVGIGRLTEEYPSYSAGMGNLTGYSHNIIFQSIAESGFLGSILFLGFWAAVFIRVVKKGFFLLPAAFLVFNLLDISFYFPSTAYPCLFVLGSYLYPSTRTVARPPSRKLFLVGVILVFLVCISREISRTVFTASYDNPRRFATRYGEFLRNNQLWYVDALRRAGSVSDQEWIIGRIEQKGILLKASEQFRRSIYLRRQEYNKYMVSLRKMDRFRMRLSESDINRELGFGLKKFSDRLK